MKPQSPSSTPEASRKSKLDFRPLPRSAHARRATECQRLQAQRIQALNQLVGGLSHEFNNLMHGILSSAELVAMDLPESHPSHESLKHLFAASKHALDFVHRLRAFGLWSPPEFRAIRLQPVVEECLQILRTIIPAKVELQAQISAECPKVNGDSAQLHQVILDLCLHCWQGLAERQGQIRITLENHHLIGPTAGAASPLPRGSYLRLTVQDNSPGLEKSACEQIFQPFRFRRSGGTKVGLELFLVRETIRGHQGELVLETEPGLGLTFHIYLPVAGNAE
jgi:signal transduction histidine kinase